jgi:hypothetical protein
MLKMIRNFIIAASLTVLLLAACSKDSNPVKPEAQDKSTNAVGCVIKQAGVEVVRAEKGKVTGTLTVKERTESPVLQFFLIAANGALFQPEDEEYMFFWEAKKMEVADVIQYQTDGRWGFRIKGFSVGSNSIAFQVLLGDQADFVSLDIPVNVTPDIGGAL